MASIKSLGASSEKWKRRAGQAGPDYERGIRNPRRPWEASTLAAENNYKLGVVAAANAGRFGKGVKRVGERKWAENSLAKGPNRFAEGVALAQQEWETGFAPFHETISKLQLPPRGPKGSPQNLQRVSAVASALRAVAEKRGGTS